MSAGQGPEVISTPTVASDSAGPKRDAKGAGLGAHPAVERNDRQRQVTHHVGERVVIERNTAHAVDSR